VLDPSRLGEVLGELAITLTGNRGVLVDDQHGHAGGARVYG
jgi:hypothetical protein